MEINGEQQCQIRVKAAWEKNGKTMKGTLQVLFQERRFLLYSFKMTIKTDTQWEMHVKVEKVCCTFIKEKQVQMLLGSTLTSALHVFGTPAGRRAGLDVWQRAGLARVSVRDGTGLSTDVGLTFLLLCSMKGWHMEHPLGQGKSLLTREAGGNVLSAALLCGF